MVTLSQEMKDAIAKFPLPPWGTLGLSEVFEYLDSDCRRVHLCNYSERFRVWWSTEFKAREEYYSGNTLEHLLASDLITKWYGSLRHAFDKTEYSREFRKEYLRCYLAQCPSKPDLREISRMAWKHNGMMGRYIKAWTTVKAVQEDFAKEAGYFPLSVKPFTTQQKMQNEFKRLRDKRRAEIIEAHESLKDKIRSYGVDLP